MGPRSTEECARASRVEGALNVWIKYCRSAKAAVRQIRERGYADKWLGGPRPVTLIGINFSPRKRNIDIPVEEL